MNKKNYIQPSEESAQLTMGSVIMVGSSGIVTNGTPIPDEGGGD